MTMTQTEFITERKSNFSIDEEVYQAKMAVCKKWREGISRLNKSLQKYCEVFE